MCRVSELVSGKPLLKKIRPSDSCLIKDAAICHEYDLRFHSDWNWIMQIVKKISELSEAAEAKLNTDSTAFYVGVQAYLTPALMDADLDKVVKIIHLFMLEYNENKES